MSMVVDNLIAYRILTMLVKPFNETEAFKLGIIDAQGKNLIKARNLTTIKQKQAYTYLHRLVFNLKRIINKLPGGESRTKNVVAAFFLVKEAYSNKSTQIDEERLANIINLLDEGLILVEEQLIVEDFLLLEEPHANMTGAGVSTDQPKIRGRRFAKFVVNDDVYKRFANGKSKYRKWSQYLNVEDEGERQIYNFAKKNPNGVIVLQNGPNTKAIRFNRRGGGAWSKIKRPIKQVNNEVV